MTHAPSLVALSLLVACSPASSRDGAEPRRQASTAAVGSSAASPIAPLSSTPPLSAITSASSAPNAPKAAFAITTPEYDGVVLVVTSAREVGQLEVGKAPIDGVWTPTASDIALFESGLGSYLTAHVPPWAKDLPKKFRPYKRQWTGLSAGGKRKIYGNFFCHEMPGWKERLVGVDDGGDCYFQIFYDVDTHTYLDLMINGMG